MPKVERETGFARRDLINIYAHYLSIYRLYANKINFAEATSQDLGGISFEVFEDNVPIIKYENKDVAEKILN